MHKKGLLVVLDGLDGAGKSFQINLLKKEFDNFASFSYPTKKTPKLRKYLDKKINLSPNEVFNLFLKDIINDQKNLSKELKKGKIVILDRYVFSTISYQLKGISFSNAKKTIKNSKILAPDIVFILDINPKYAYERKKKQKIPDRYESDINYLKDVRKNFKKLAKEKFLSKNWYVLNASKDACSINKRILSLIKNKI